MTIDEILDAFADNSERGLSKYGAKAQLAAVIDEALPERDNRVFPGIEPGQDPVRETCYQQGWNECLDDVKAALASIVGEK